MKKLHFIILSLLFTFAFSSIKITAAEINHPVNPTFFDDFSDATKSVAKSENVIYEPVDPQSDIAYITRSDTKDGYIIWKLEDLAYGELGVIVYDGLGINIKNAVSLEVSTDGESWSNLSFDVTNTGGSEWISFTLSASTKAPVKYIKVVLKDTGNAAWSVKLNGLALYNTTDAPDGSDNSSSPNTGESNENFIILFVSLTGILFISLSFKKQLVLKDKF